MRVFETPLAGVLILEPSVFEDTRGSFSETFSAREFVAAVADSALPDFVQDNESWSHPGVVRGLHFQRAPHAQAKLVRVVSGTIFDVAVDMRASSPTFGRHVRVELSGENRRQLYIPRGFAHGFSVVGSAPATVIYKVDGYYEPSSDGGVRWDDPALGIDWGLDPGSAIVSAKDAALPPFASAYTFI